jgi:sortase A
MRLARLLGAVGRVCITAGVLILLFVAYQLWGTGIRTAQAQNDLEEDFAAVLDAAGETTSTSSSPTTSTTSRSGTSTTTPAETVPTIAPVPEGEATARIVAPAIGLDKIVVEGVSLDDLKKGPGHYPETPLPGQEGNAAIAGHRTTYGAPFHRLDELEKGDEITVTTVQGEFTYLVSATHIVSPTEVHVLQDKGDNRLTLTACHPKYSARQRIVVVAQLEAEETPLPRPFRDADAPLPATLDDIDGAGKPAWPAVVLGLACALIWFGAWLLGRSWRKWLSYLIGFPIFMVTLFFFFEEFSRLLPSNF